MSENNRYFCDCGKDDKDMYNCGCKKDNCKKDDCRKDDKCHDDKKYYPENKCCDDKKHHEKKHDECCCKLSLIKALELLGCEVNDLVNFNAAAFITDYYVGGGNLALFEPNTSIGNLDNLGSVLTGALKKLPDCNCDILDIDADTVYPIPLPTDLISLLYGLIDLLGDLVGADAALDAILTTIITLLVALINALNALTGDALTALLNTIAAALVSLFTTLEGVDTASLCEIRALAFDLIPDAPVVPGTPCCTETNFARLRRELKCILKEKCPAKVDCKPDCEPCCCDKGVLSQVAGSNIASTVSLTVGSLTLENVEVLGTIDNAIILAAPPAAATTITFPAITILGIAIPGITLPVAATPGRLYVVCADAVTFID